jgi:hypothetical protein
MPTLSVFFGIVIAMYWDDHAPPHFHALYGDDEVLIAIKTLDVMRGKIPRRALSLVLEWAQENRDALLKDWDLCQRNQMPLPIYWATFALPATYFIEILRGIILRGAVLADLWANVAGLAVCAAAILGLALARFRKQLQ